jgi:hypothetical protein
MATNENEHEISEEIISSITNDNDFKALDYISEKTLANETKMNQSMKMADTIADTATVRITPTTPELKATSEIPIMTSVIASMIQKSQELLEEIPRDKIVHQKELHKRVTASPESSTMTLANASMTSLIITATLKPSTASVKAEAMMSTITPTTLPTTSDLISEGEHIGNEESFQAYRAMFIAVLCLLAIAFCLCFIS